MLLTSGMLCRAPLCTWGTHIESQSSGPEETFGWLSPSSCILKNMEWHSFSATEWKQQSLFICIENEMKHLHNCNESHKNSSSSNYYYFNITVVHVYTPMPVISKFLTNAVLFQHYTYNWNLIHRMLWFHRTLCNFKIQEHCLKSLYRCYTLSRFCPQ